MDNKRNMVGLIVVIALSMIWLQVIWPMLAKKYHWETAPAPVPTAVVTPPTTATTNPVEVEAARLAAPHAEGAATNQQTVKLGYGDYEPDLKHLHSAYPLGLSLTSRGAAMESATLNRFRETVDAPDPYVFQKPVAIDSPLNAALATRWIAIDGAPPIALDSIDWNVANPTSAPATAPASASAVTFVAEVKTGATPSMRISKTFELRPDTDKSTAGYEVSVRYAVENLTAAAHNVRFGFNGTNVPHPENSRDVPEVVAGFDAGRVNVAVKHSSAASVKANEPLDVRGMEKDEKLLWTGVASSYFDAIVRPTDAAGNPWPLAKVSANLLAVSSKDAESVTFDCETSDLVVPASGSNGFTLNTYLGPKARAVLKNDYYSAFPLSYDDTLVLTGSCYSVCTWAWLINILVGLLQGFHFILRDWGLSIIGLVVLVRLILHPVTKMSQVSMSRMTKLGPEMERLKKKYGEDTEGLKRAQVEFYREQGVAPFLGCLPMFLQMPIWIALWSSLQSTFEIRHAPFLQVAGKHLTWIHDLAQPDRLIAFKQPISLLFLHMDGLNVLPLLMGIVFYVNQKLQPQPMALKPEQAQQQKMMQWMSVLMFPLFLYASPSGLNLYIFTSTLIGIFESKRIRAHIKQKDERDKAGIAIVDEPIDNDRRGGPTNRAKVKTPPPASGGIAGFLAKMQQYVEEAKNDKERQQKKNGR